MKGKAMMKGNNERQADEVKGNSKKGMSKCSLQSQISIFIKKRPFFSGNLKSYMPGDSQNALPHCRAEGEEMHVAKRAKS